MKSRKFILFVFFVVLAISIIFKNCSQTVDEGRILAKINDYTLTVNDFENEIKYSPYTGDETVDKERILDLAIRRQLLIQEAQRQGLDRSKSFMKTIERYWKQTLIKELLDEETQRISQEVSPDKQDEALRDWMEALYDKADIRINRELLE